MNLGNLTVAGLLASLGVVLGFVAVAVAVYRRNLALLRRPRLLALDGSSGRRPSPWPAPRRWLAARTTNTALVAETVGAKPGGPCVWSDALARAQQRFLFVSAPVDGWTLVIGGGLPDASADPDRLYHFLRRVSGALGEVCYFSTDRVLNYHSWARLERGWVRRAYAWGGEALWNEGPVTPDEHELGLRCRSYGEAAETPGFGETSAEQQNAERVSILARLWSVDLALATELLLQQEAVEQGGDDVES